MIHLPGPWRGRRLRRQGDRDLELIRASELFDPAWYLATYPDVASSGQDPYVHYFVYGGKEGRHPGPRFDSHHYLLENPDIERAGLNPLVHYLRRGRAEGRRVTPVGAFSIFDTRPEVAPLPLHYRRGGRPRVTLVTESTSPEYLFGGVMTSIVLAVLWAERLGATVRLVTRSTPPDLSRVGAVLTASGVAPAPDIDAIQLPPRSPLATADLTDDDLFLTTSWWTTRATLGSVPVRQVVYLIQEDERLFYPGGDSRLRCQEVLDEPALRFAVNTELLHRHLAGSGAPNVATAGAWFEPSFPSPLYHPREHEGQRRRFAFYARPKNLRNLYERGLEVVVRAIEQGILSPQEWEFIFFGSPPDSVILPRGVRPTYNSELLLTEYAELLGTMDLGLALMYSPHPSYPPLDLAASGAVVVTNRFAGKQSLSIYSDNILVGGTSTAELVNLLAQGAALAADRPRRAANHSNSQLARDWRASTESLLEWLTSRVD
jgi:hypothetical protein